jgi:cell division septation protein DedD
MRIFAILLLLTNLAYFGWHWYSGQDAQSLPEEAPVRHNGQTLQLLSELEAEPVQVLEAPEPATCLSLGVFNSTDESDFLVSALRSRGMEAGAELLDSGITVNYRVYMPPFNSETAARQALEQLQSGGVDSFIISNGDLAGGISLGLFTQEELALALQEKLAGEGFAMSIQEIQTPKNEIWVTIRGLSQALFESSELVDLLTEGLDLAVIEKPCETIASRP